MMRMMIFDGKVAVVVMIFDDEVVGRGCIVMCKKLALFCYDIHVG